MSAFANDFFDDARRFADACDLVFALRVVVVRVDDLRTLFFLAEVVFFARATFFVAARFFFWTVFLTAFRFAVARFLTAVFFFATRFLIVFAEDAFFFRVAFFRGGMG